MQFYSYDSAWSRFSQLDYFETLKVFVKLRRDENFCEDYPCVLIMDTKVDRGGAFALLPRGFPLSKIIDDNEYLVTMCNQYHQQLYYPMLVAIHKNMTTGEELTPWDKNFDSRSFEQAYKLQYRTHHR
jgi:hypothetical protein